jgi:adenine-specific DNA-methyltransferase
MGFWSNVDRQTMRYELFGLTPDRGQWKWKWKEH